jgi:uncharacterized membrane protein
MTKCNDILVREKVYLSKYEFCMSSLLIANIMAKQGLLPLFGYFVLVSVSRNIVDVIVSDVRIDAS